MQAWWPIGLIVISNVFYHICSRQTPDTIHPLASLSVTYLIGAATSVAVYFLIDRGGSLAQEYRHLNWSACVLGIAIVGLEVGSIYMYKLGWNLNTGHLTHSALLAIALLLVGYLFYHEAITANKLIGIVLCLAGIAFLNR
ncbi:MAG: EamA family transporter [Oscillospiraceae bacterium]|nr:EamA family transporter [Oscillospiraceae bacterium]